MMKIESSDTNVERLFTSDFLIIPRFQRPYSWDDENLEDFWKDVAQAEGEDYFIGSMVLYPSGRQQYGVVDGQQRLTTITILLCVIRNIFQELGSKNLAKGVHALIERGDRESVNSYVVMTETSYPFFAEEIQKFDEKDFRTEPQREEKRLQASYNFFEKKVRGILNSVDEDSTIAKEGKSETKINRLKELRDSVLFLSLIRIELDNEDDAYLIFETLNTRGKDLALTDLLKNHFLKTIKGKGSVDGAKELWTKILSTINGSEVDIDPDTFFTHSWSSKFEATTQQKAYKKIKSAVTTRNAKDQLKGFVADAEHYVAIFNPDQGWRKDQKEIIASLKAMRIFKISQHTPGALSLVRANKTGLISDKTLKRALKAIEDFHFLFTAVTSSRSSGGISAMYSSFGRKLFEADSANEAGAVINEMIDKLEERKPSPSEFTAGFEQISYTNDNTKQSSLVRYTLQKIASHQKLAFSDDIANLTIEHIFPQAKMDANWTPEIVGSFGNLLLLTQKDNGKLKDDDFKKKILVLKQLNGSVPEEILDAQEWTREIVLDRTKALAEIAYQQIWKIK
jgi:transcription termination factor NusB